MRVIFLDFDGVILTMRCAIADGRGHSGSAPDPLACAVIRRACEAGVRLVISSAWRSSKERVMEKLTQGGLEPFLLPGWRTRNNSENRPLVIAEWLEAHPEVFDYRILDDDPFDWTPDQRRRWLQCDPLNGFQWEEMAELLKWAGVQIRDSGQRDVATPRVPVTIA
jgi:hypothetical protein